MRIVIFCLLVCLFVLRFTIFEIIFIFWFWNKNFTRIGCAKARLLQIDRIKLTSHRSSCSQMFFKTGNLENFAIFTKKHLLFEYLFNKVALNFFIFITPTQVFPVNIATFLRGAFDVDYWWLLSTWPYHMLCIINELVTLSSCAMS